MTQKYWIPTLSLYFVTKKIRIRSKKSSKNNILNYNYGKVDEEQMITTVTITSKFFERQEMFLVFHWNRAMMLRNFVWMRAKNEHRTKKLAPAPNSPTTPAKS